MMVTRNYKSLALSLLLTEAHAKGMDMRFMNAHHRFADDLTTELYNKDNDFSSSWGVSMLLSLFYPASDGKTRQEMSRVLGYPANNNQLVWEDTANALDNAYDGSCTNSYGGKCTSKAPTLEIANSIWINEGVILDEDYSKHVGSFVYQTDFSSPEAGGEVNDWVDKSTNGLIDEIIDEGPIYDSLIAINSIYLKATWVKKFDEEFTNEDVFYTTPERNIPTKQNAQFMHMVEYLEYSDNALPGYQIISMPYVESELSLVVVLPLEESSGVIRSNQIVRAIDKLESTRVALAFPKFQYKSEYDLKKPLQATGLLSPFQSEYGFCGLFEGDSCYPINAIIQKTFINVHEKGTEAAAVTMGSVTTMLPTDDPKLVMADHPFQFFIYDAGENLVIFEGSVGDPGIPDDAEPAKLKSKHANTDFWSQNFYVDPIDDIAIDPPRSKKPLSKKPRSKKPRSKKPRSKKPRSKKPRSMKPRSMKRSGGRS